MRYPVNLIEPVFRSANFKFFKQALNSMLPVYPEMKPIPIQSRHLWTDKKKWSLRCCTEENYTRQRGACRY